MQEHYDTEFAWEKEFQLLPADKLSVKGLNVFGHVHRSKAFRPIDEHYHPNCMEVTVIVEGNQKYLANGTEYSIFGGEAFTTFVNEAHSSGEHPQAVNEIYWFQLDMSEMRGFLALQEPWDAKLFHKLKEWHQRTVKVSKEEVDLLRKSFAYFSKREIEGKDFHLQGYSFFLTFLVGMLEKTDSCSEMTHDIQKVMEFINLHIEEQIYIEELANLSGLSVTHLKKKFRQQIGISPREYINLRKVEQAKEMLKNASGSVTEIAYTLQFGSSNYFASVFKQFAGCSPSEYREYCTNSSKI